MSITREQVADLREGDVVELTRSDWPEGTVVRGPLRALASGGLAVGATQVRYTHGEPVGILNGDRSPWSLTVVSRAPRPLYVNHPRTEPVPGDVVLFKCDDSPDESYVDAYLPCPEREDKPWVSLVPDDPGTRYSDEDARCDHLDGWRAVLLVDGETGQVVPS